jgi:hypothetical protein
MRAFQPIARRAEAERNKNLWTPPPVLRRIAWCILLGTAAFQLIIGCRMILFLLAVQNNSAYELTHKWPGSPFQLPALFLVFACIPFTVPARRPQEKKKHIPNPALSIRPR